MKYNITKCLGANVRLLRRRMGLGRKEFALRSRISATYVGLIECGERFPSAEVIERIAEVLCVPWSRLFEDDSGVFAKVSGDEWTEFQQRLETVTVCVEEMHEMIEDFCGRERHTGLKK